jgi:hypothetical protein
MAVYDLAEKCLLSTYTIVASVQDVISPGHLPIYKSGHFGRRDLRTHWSQKSSRAKFEDDKLVLLEAFPDFMGMTMMTGPIAEDELIRGFRNMGPNKDIPLWFVFAAQCFLDVQHVLEQDLDRPHKQLLQTGDAIRDSIKHNLEFHKSLRVDTWPRTNDFKFKEMLTVIEDWVQGDIVASTLKKVSHASRVKIASNSRRRNVRAVNLSLADACLDWKQHARP